MAGLSLNSWLVQSERSIHLKCPTGLNVAQDEYLEALKISAKELELPLELETCQVDWVDANLHQTRIRVKLQSNERFGLLTGLDYIGRVAFVEQKTYLDPVSLPTKEEPSYGAAIGIGIGGVLLGIILFAVGSNNGGGMQCLGGLIFIAAVAIAIPMASSASKAPQKKRTEAIENWVKEVLDLARRAEISNELNRTAQALDEAVKVAVDRLFTQRGAQMEADEKKRKTANEIQTELENRKKQGL